MTSFDITPNTGALFTQFLPEIAPKPLIRFLQGLDVDPDARTEALRLFNGFAYAAAMCTMATTTVAQLEQLRNAMKDALTVASDGYNRAMNGPPYVVGVYLIDRAYGGPEEGGWYYDCGSLVTDPAPFEGAEDDYVALRELLKAGLKGFDNERDAKEYRHELQELLDATVNQGRRSIYSVLSDGQYQAQVHDFECPEHYPESQATLRVNVHDYACPHPDNLLRGL